MRATMASAESDFDRQKLPHDLILILADGTSGALEVADALGYVFLDDGAQRGGSVSMPGHPSQFTEERQARLGAKSVSAAQDECGG